MEDKLHLSVDVVLTAFIIIMGIAGWFIRKKIERFDKHLEECHQKALNHARLEERFTAVDGKVDALKELMDTKIDAVSDKLDQIAEALIPPPAARRR